MALVWRIEVNALYHMTAMASVTMSMLSLASTLAASATTTSLLEVSVALMDGQWAFYIMMLVA